MNVLRKRFDTFGCGPNPLRTERTATQFHDRFRPLHNEGFRLLSDFAVSEVAEVEDL